MLELLNPYANLQVNGKLAQLLGLIPAVYCSELLAINVKAKAKNKLIDNEYFKLDRKYMVERTTISIEEQLKIDAALSKINLLKKHQDNPDILYLDTRLLASMLNNDDLTLIEDIRSKIKIKSPKGVKESVRQRTIAELKSSIECSNYELLTALRDWVDTIYLNPKAYLSKTAIKIFQDTLNNYAKGNLDLALRLVQIATIQGYKDCSWAISLYEKDLSIAKKQNNVYKLRPTTIEPKVATKKDLSDEVF